MAAYWNQRCSLCGQFVPDSDREAMLEAQRWEWDEALVDEALVDRHFCIDSDPNGARQWARLAGAGEMVPELRWLLQAELERRQAAPLAAWAVFTGSAASSTMVLAGRPAMACCRPSSGAPRPVQGRVCDHLPAARPGRAPPGYARTGMLGTLSHGCRRSKAGRALIPRGPEVHEGMEARAAPRSCSRSRTAYQQGSCTG